jgi:hypothetical protein
VLKWRGWWVSERNLSALRGTRTRVVRDTRARGGKSSLPDLSHRDSVLRDTRARASYATFQLSSR